MVATENIQYSTGVIRVLPLRGCFFQRRVFVYFFSFFEGEYIIPKEKVINMDVKFPLAHYERYIDSDDEHIRSSEKAAFLKDVKKHVRDITKRSYIDPSSGTLDYVLMLVPNESIYSFINKEDSAVIDFALENKVLLCSPLTLYAILSLNAASQSGGMFLWSDGSITEDLNVSPSVTTVYDVTYSVGGCLPATASATVTVNPLPSVTFSSNIWCRKPQRV